jgi:hypothetical protein
MRIKECVGGERTRDAKRLVYVQNVGNGTVNAYHTEGEPANDILPCRRRHSSTFEGVSMPPHLGIQEASSCSNRLEEQSPFLSPNRPKDAISGACPVPLTLFSYPIYGFGRQRARCSLPGTRSPLHGRLSTLTTLQPRKGFLAKAAEAWYLLPSLPESGGARQLSICSARSCGVSSSLFKKEILSDVP